MNAATASAVMMLLALFATAKPLDWCSCGATPGVECLLWDQSKCRHPHKTVWVNINPVV